MQSFQIVVCSVSQHPCRSLCLVDEIHQLWREIKTLYGGSLYYNPYTGRWDDSCCHAHHCFIRVLSSLSRKKLLRQPLPHGGILADEMGLGKTVEVLACILANQMPNRQVDLIENFNNGLMDTEQDDSRVQCVCGCQEKDRNYRGTWIQCEECRYWQHLSCVGFTPDVDETFICARCWTRKVSDGMISEAVIGLQCLPDSHVIYMSIAPLDQQYLPVAFKFLYSYGNCQ